ncbi:hypothetical protein SISNIDRAFT_525460 [Sistotremastrum niveocremeum HHB9708]|uniref:Uncharacterized protein n=1 Tax=Sistotremastrum niveocremeum HHB9708 TaxID=1314777 RepID=A0A164QU95_9AGAM|nr:hypothetical protein SISNIDRAFT_525460 [Sistotremastrum niveocremeum HHB9708]
MQSVVQQQQQQQQQTQQSTQPHSLVNVSNIPVQEPYPKPIVAQGHDWTKNLIQLAKTAELKKHALTLQLHTAHILAAHASLDQKNKALQDIKEQKNRIESERKRLLDDLAQINSDRDKIDISESSITKETADLRSKIQSLTDGPYAVAKRDVDVLRQELGQPPLPSLQSTLEERNAANMSNTSGSTSMPETQRNPETGEPPAKRPRGRPKGSKNKPKILPQPTS